MGFEPIDVRQQKIDEANQHMINQGIKGALTYGAIGIATDFLLARYSGAYKRYVFYGLRAFLVSSTFVAGYWINSEESLREHMQSEGYNRIERTREQLEAAKRRKALRQQRSGDAPAQDDGSAVRNE